MLWNRHCSQDSTSTRSGSQTFTIESGGSGGERSDKADCGDHHHRHRARNQDEFEGHINRSPTRKTTDCIARSAVELTPGSPSITSGRGRRQGSRVVVSHRGSGFGGGNGHLEVSPSSASAESPNGDSPRRERGRQETNFRPRHADIVEDLPASLNSVAERDEEIRSDASQILQPSHDSVGGLDRLSEESLSPPAFTADELGSSNDSAGEGHHQRAGRGRRDHYHTNRGEALRMPATGEGGTSLGSRGVSDPATPSSHLPNKAKEVEAAFSMTPMKRRMARMQMGWSSKSPAGAGSSDATGHTVNDEMKWERHESPSRPMSSSPQRSKLQAEEVDRSTKYPDKSDNPSGPASRTVGEAGKTSRISVMEGESEQDGVELVLKSEQSTPQRATQGRGRVTNDDADRSPPPRRPRPLRPPPASSTDSADKQGEWSAPGYDPNSPSHHQHPHAHYSPDDAARQSYYGDSGASHGPHHYYPRWTGRQQQPYSPHLQHHYSPHQQHHSYHAPYSPPPSYTSAPPGSFGERSAPNMADPPPPGDHERHRRPPPISTSAQSSDVKIVSPPKEDEDAGCPPPPEGQMGYHRWGESHQDQYPHGQPYYPSHHSQSPHHTGQSNYSPPRRQAHYQYPPSSPVRRNASGPGQEQTPSAVGPGPRRAGESDGSRDGQYDHRHPPQYGPSKGWWGPSHSGSNASVVSESFDSNDRMSKDLAHSRGSGHYSPERRSGGPPGGGPAIGSSPSWNYQHPPPHHGYGHHYPTGGDPHGAPEDLSSDYVPPPYSHERHEQTGYPLGSSGDEGDRQQHTTDDTDHPLLRDYNPTKDRIPPSRSPLRRKGREVVILTPSSGSDREKGDVKGGKGSSPNLTPGSDDNTPITSNTSSSSSSALTRPAAASEINFEVTNPPMEPITPASEEPVCTNPSLVNTHDVLFGRGGGTNTQVGNRRFRSLVQDFRNIYLMARRKEKPLIARSIVLIIRNRGGRFLKKDDVTGMMYEVGDEKAEAKTSQALREGLDVRATKSAANSLLRRNSSKDGGKDSKKGNKKKGGKDDDKSDDEDLSSKDDPTDIPESGRDGPPQAPLDRPPEESHEHRPHEGVDGSGYYYPYGTHSDGPNKRRRDGVGPPPPPGPYYPPPTYSSYPPYYYPPHARDPSVAPAPQSHHSHLQQSFSEEDSMVLGDFSPPRTKVPRPNSPDAPSTQMHDAGTPPIRNIGTNSSSSGEGGPVHPPVPPPQHYPHMPPPQHYPPQQHPYYPPQHAHPYHHHPHYPPHSHGYHYHQHGGSRPPVPGQPHHPPGPAPHGHHGGGSYKGYEGNSPPGGNCSDTTMMATEAVSPQSKWSAV